MPDTLQSVLIGAVAADRAIPPEAVDHMVKTLTDLHARLSDDLDTRRKTLF